MFPPVKQTNSLLVLNKKPENASPSPANWVGFGVEDDFLEVKCLWRSEKKVEVFEGFGEQETMH